MHHSISVFFIVSREKCINENPYVLFHINANLLSKWGKFFCFDPFLGAELLYTSIVTMNAKGTYTLEFHNFTNSEPIFPKIGI